MKINKVYISNLNSLRGEVTIDFTEPPLAYTGLFAITGDTGAGKTTILDAITLALYGSVPRSKGVKELMSYGTAEAVAEVEFEVMNTRYRTKWTDWRARGRLDGKLQGPKRELAKWNEKTAAFEIIAEKIKEVDDAIEAITGLDYNRFRRSVLLAQGDFAAFLEANESDRGGLLERITGTELYSDLSKAAFERAKLEREALYDLDQQLKNMALLLPEEVRQLETQLAQWQSEAEELETAISEDQKVLATYEQQQQAEQRIRGLEDSLAAFRQKEKDQAAAFHQLAVFEQVQYLRQPFENWQAIRSEKEGLLSSLSAHQEEIKGLETNLLAKDQALKEANNRRQLLEVEMNELAPKWEAAVTLDAEVKALQEPLQKQQQIVRELEQEQLGLQTRQESWQQELAQKTVTLAEYQKWLQEHQELASLHQEFSLLAEKNQDFNRLKNQLGDLERQGAELGLQLHQHQQKEAMLQASLKALQEKQEKQKQQFEESAGRDFTSDRADFLQELSQKVQLYGQEQIDLQKAVKDLGEYDQLLARLAALQDLVNDLQRASNKYNIQILNQLDLLAEVESDHQYKWKVYQQQQLLVNYEKDRSNLKTGEPCPLCGSKEHPFTAHLPEAYVDEAKVAFEQQDQFLRKCKKDYQLLLGRQAQINETIGKNRQQQEKLEEQLHFYEQKLAEVFPQFSFMDSQVHLNSDTLRTQLDQKGKALQEVQLLQQTLRKLHENLVQSEKEIQQQDSQLQQAVYEIKIAKNRQEQLSEQLSKIQMSLKEVERYLSARLTVFLPKGKDIPFGKAIQELEAALEVYLDRTQQIGLLDKAIQRLETQIAQTKEAREQAIGKWQLRQQECKATEEALKVKKEARFALLEERDPKMERTGYQNRKKELEAEVESLQASHKSQEKELTKGQQVLAEAEKRMQTLGEQEQKIQANIEAALPRHQLASIDALADVLLSPEQEAKIRKEKANLEKELARLVGLLDEQRKMAGELSQSLQDAATQSVIQAQVEEKRGVFRSILNKTGAIQERLQANERKKAAQQQLLEERQTQDQVFRKWEALNEIIGSADGKKFRTFAQGLTLERLVQIANRHLETLHGRYKLLKPEEEDLALMIVDTFQADHQRSPETLSGGEKFLVSLALALGLSDLAGRQAQIHSLFIDEGFGTLDDNSLDLAISTLENLQASGKTIGVISHVKALKERIGTRIEVDKKSDGFSTVQVLS